MSFHFLSLFLSLFLFLCLLHESHSQQQQQLLLNSNEQEAVYTLLESINPSQQWRLNFPDDLCSSAPHGILCDYFNDTDTLHITELNFGYVSDYSPNPPCTPNSTIHSHHFTPFTHLRKLFFYKCFTKSPIPFPVFSPLNVPPIQHLVFIDNPSLFGSIKLTNITTLRRLILTGTNVSGEIISDFFTNNINIEEITLSRNNLSGQLPDLGNLKKLKILDLSYNRFNGKVPESTGDLTGLLKLDLCYNQFSGGIPESLKGLKNLEFLDISHNKFINSGIPIFFSTMTGLRELYLSGNFLGGEIPEIWENLGGIIGIGLSRTGLVGNIPGSIGVFLKNLSYIGLDNNGLQGSIPMEFGSFGNGCEINLENNRLSGRVPPFMVSKKFKLVGNPDLCFEEMGSINGSLVDLKLCKRNRTYVFDPHGTNLVLLSSSSSSFALQICMLCYIMLIGLVFFISL